MWTVHWDESNLHFNPSCERCCFSLQELKTWLHIDFLSKIQIEIQSKPTDLNTNACLKGEQIKKKQPNDFCISIQVELPWVTCSNDPIWWLCIKRYQQNVQFSFQRFIKILDLSILKTLVGGQSHSPFVVSIYPNSKKFVSSMWIKKPDKAATFLFFYPLNRPSNVTTAHKSNSAVISAISL